MKNYLKLLVAIVLLGGLVESASAAVYLSADGSYGKFNKYLEKTVSIGAKGSIAADINSNFRVSYSYKYGIEKVSGYQDYTSGNTVYLYKINSRTLTRIHAIDLIGVLYNGTYFVPFIFGGAAYKLYDMKYENEAVSGVYNVSKKLGPVENFGCGLSIALSSSFSLKVTNTWSPGIKLVPEEYLTSEGTKVYDSVTEVGISLVIR